VIRAVYDTNTLASASIAISGPLVWLVDAWTSGRVQVLVSQHILRELETTLNKPYVAARLSAVTREKFLLSARTTTTIVAITAPVPNVARARADNLVLATAASAGAPFLVTGDLELQRMGQYREVVILSPRRFLEVVEFEAPSAPIELK